MAYVVPLPPYGEKTDDVDTVASEWSREFLARQRALDASGSMSRRTSIGRSTCDNYHYSQAELNIEVTFLRSCRYSWEVHLSAPRVLFSRNSYYSASVPRGPRPMTHRNGTYRRKVIAQLDWYILSLPHNCARWSRHSCHDVPRVNRSQVGDAFTRVLTEHCHERG